MEIHPTTGWESRLLGRDLGVVVISYMRPEMTDNAIRTALSNSDYTVIVTVDGLRCQPEPQEVEWREEVIRLSKVWSSQCDRVVTIIWHENGGLIDHGMRFLAFAFQYFRGVITLEDDQELSEEGFRFLSNSVSRENGPSNAVPYVRRFHPRRTDGRATLFPNLWGASFNREFYLELKKTVHLRQIERETVREAVKSLDLSDRLTNRVVGYWVNLFREAAASDYHMDALMQYTAMRAGSPWKAPAKTLLKDLGYLDDRGLNPRNSRDRAQIRCHSCQARPSCLLCDREAARVKLSKFPRYQYSLVYEYLNTRNSAVFRLARQVRASIISQR